MKTEPFDPLSTHWAPSWEAVTGSTQVIVQLRPSLTAGERQSLQGELRATVVHQTQRLGLELWEIPDSNLEAWLARYQTDSRLSLIVPNITLQLTAAVPNDPGFGRNWALHNLAQNNGTLDADIDAPEAWEIHAGAEFVVGVIDTGVDYTHPDLVGSLWTNSGEIPHNGLDDDGNGYVDDYYGYNFANDTSDPFDNSGHGTLVAGIIAAQGNNQQGVIGVNPSARIMALKFTDAFGAGSVYNAVRAIDYATAMGVRITNNSWGADGQTQLLFNAIANANAAGSLFIAAAGNTNTNLDQSPGYPVNYNLDNIIAVTATDQNDQLYSFANFGATQVDLGAPGVDIYSTFPGSTYATASGTSFAAPYVAGVASLIWSQNPTLTAQQVRERLLSTTDPLSALSGITVTGGRVNAYHALTNTPSTGIDAPSTTPLPNPSFDQNTLTDLVWRNLQTGQNSIWYMNQGIWSGHYDLPMAVADLNWQIVGTGDFTDDGQTDLLWRNLQTGQNSIWHMVGGQWMGDYTLLPSVTDPNWQIVGTGDFNRDTQPDLLWRNGQTGQNSIWYMTGTAWGGQYDLPLAVSDLNWQIVGTGDFNQDSHTDLLWRNQQTGENSIWYMNQGAWTGHYTLVTTVSDLHWTIAGAQDFNQDAQPDILWRNQQTGQNSIWYMNQGTWTYQYDLPMAVPDLNWQVLV